MVLVQDRVDDTNGILQAKAMKFNYVTPRDYLDFINHYISLVSEKRGEVFDSKSHLEKGLLKLRETEEQVANLKSGLLEKEAELKQNNLKAEEKMQQMVKNQSEAEQKKQASLLLATDLEKKSVEIKERSESIEKELVAVKPTLDRAMEAVSNINPKHMQELRVMSSPPSLVKLTLSATIVMVYNMGKESLSWDTIRNKIKKPDFIA